MQILKKWNEHPDKLIAEGEPVDWFETTEEELLRHTEEAGFYKPGTVISALEEGAQLRTPSAFYKAVEHNAHPTLGESATSQAVINAETLSKSDGVPPSAPARVA